MMQPAALLLVVVGVAAWTRLLARSSPACSRLALLAGAAGSLTVASTLAAVGLVEVGWFRPEIALAIGGLPPALGLWRRPAPSGARRRVAAPLEAVAVLLALPLALAVRPTLEPLRMVGDAGVYANRAVHHLAQGDAHGRIPLRDRLHGDLLAAFDRDNSSPPYALEAVAGDRIGGYLPGTYLDPRQRSRFEFQFLPGWPMAMALWAGVFGVARLFDVLPALLALSIVLFGLILQRHGRGFSAPIAALLLFCSSPLLLFFARYSTSEMFLLFLFLFVLHFGTQPSALARQLVFAAVLLLGLSHASVFLYAPLPLLVALEAHRRGDRRLGTLAAAVFAALLVALPLAVAASPRYLHDVYAYAFGALPLADPAGAGMVVVALVYAGGLALSIAVRPGGQRPRWAAGRLAWPWLAAPVLAALLLATVLRAWQLGWTRRLAEQAHNPGGWARRAEYVDRGFASLLHLNLVSMLMATALVALPVVLALALRRRRAMVASPFRALLLAAVLLSLGIHTLLRPDTPFNYLLSRYFLPVFVPCTLLLVGLVPPRLAPARGLAALLLVVGLGFNLRHGWPAARESSRDRALGFVMAVERHVPRGRVLFVAADPLAFSTLAIPLASRAQIAVVRVARAEGVPARERIERYCSALGLERAFWLGPRSPSDGRRLAALTLAESEPPEQILYPTRFLERRRTYVLAELQGACRPRRGHGEEP